MSNNLRIAQNTIFLYIRLIIIMLVGFYTVRIVLDQLGAVDYGIYNVVGGVVTMFSFLNGTLSSSSQRYFSVALIKGDLEKLNKIFSLNVSIFLFMAGIIVLIAETGGLWFVNNKMTIPEDRLIAANVVYQCSIAAFVINMISVPYNALIIAHEKMKAFAQISIIEAFLKLFIVIFIAFSSSDKLIIYGGLMFCVSTSITLSYIIYCRRNFKESKFHLFWDKTSVIELLSFSGWHFLGTISSVLRTQGVNILINVFFNPAINAARAISVQVSNAVSELSNNFFVAVKPQIYKDYASGDLYALHQLVLRSSIICAFLVSILVIPLVVCCDFILNLWLKEVPEYAVVFTQLMLWHSLVYSINGCTIAPALATGKIKRFEMWTSGLNCLTLPVAYVILKMGYCVEYSIIVTIIISAATILLQAYMLKDMVKFPFLKYLILILKLIIVSVFLCYVIYLIPHNNNEWIGLISVTVCSCLLHIIIYFIFVINKDDRKLLFNLINKI